SPDLVGCARHAAPARPAKEGSADHDRPGLPVAARPATRKGAHATGIVLARRIRGPRALAHSCSLYARVALGSVARRRARILPRHRAPVLVAGDSTLAQHRKASGIVDHPVLVSGYVALRCSFRIAGIWRPCGLPHILLRRAAVGILPPR